MVGLEYNQMKWSLIIQIEDVLKYSLLSPFGLGQLQRL